MQRTLASRLAAIVIGTALCAAPALAADAQNPYGNVNHRVDAGNNTGDSQVERLNEQQLRNIHQTSGYDARGGQGGYHAPYNDGRPGSGAANHGGNYGRPGYGGYRGGYYGGGYYGGYRGGYGYGVRVGVPYGYGGYYGYGVPYAPAYYRPYAYYGPAFGIGFRPGFFGWGFRGGFGFGGFRGGYRGRW